MADNCSFESLRDKAMNSVVDEFMKDNNDKIFTRGGNFIYGETSPNVRMPILKKRVSEGIVRVQKWIDKNFTPVNGNKKYTGGWVKRVEYGTKGVTVQFKMPASTQELLKRKADENLNQKRRAQVEKDDLKRRKEGNWTQNEDGDIVPLDNENLYQKANEKIVEESYEDDVIESGLEWAKQVFSQADIDLVKGLIEGIAKGSYNTVTDLIQISTDFATKGTIKHEVGHNIFNWLPQERREELLNEGSKLFGIPRGESKRKIKYSQAQQNEIQYTLKSIDILSNLTQKQQQEWSKWQKGTITTEQLVDRLQIPKEHKDIVLNSFKKLEEERSPITLDSLKKLGKFKNTIVEFVDEIPSSGDKPVSFRNINKGEKFLFNEEEFKKVYENKGWTVSRTQKDGSKSTPLSEDAFKTFDEFLNFALLHENAHSYIHKEAGETFGEYEDRINNEAFKNLGDSQSKLSPQEIILDIASNYSFAVEINTAKEQLNRSERLDEIEQSRFPNKKIGDEITLSNNETYLITGFTEIEDIDDWNGNATVPAYTLTQKNKIEQPTQYYFDLTVNENFYKNNPDWEYKEQRITTPLITPSIKGHAQFAESNDIGWVRAWYNKKTGEVHVLEVQSDLFQKGRDNIELIPSYQRARDTKEWMEIEIKAHNALMNNEITEEEYKRRLKTFEDNYENNLSKNQFLQLLNKNNNWVTFFVKSIIQDSVKKGYEKVLFPKGDTAAKIEGHQTLEEFKKQKEARIKELENKKQEEQNEFGLEGWRYKSDDGFYKEHNRYGRENLTKEIFNNALNQKQGKINNEINQLKQELERVEVEGFAALRPIYNFYENTVTNILKKQGFNPVEITDEYGNKWNSIELTPEIKQQVENIKFSSPELEYEGDLAIEERIMEELEKSPDAHKPNTVIGKFIQALRDFLKDIFKQRNEIQKFTDAVNNGRYSDLQKPQNFNASEQTKYSKVTSQQSEAIDIVWKQNPELANLFQGNKQLYQEYLESIFPDSQLKDIVYHGSAQEFEEFDNTIGQEFSSTQAHEDTYSFTTDFEIANGYKERAPKGTAYRGTEKVYAVMLNVQNPTTLDYEGRSWKGTGFRIFDSIIVNDYLLNDIGTEIFPSENTAINRVGKWDSDYYRLEEVEKTLPITDDFGIEAMENGFDAAIMKNVSEFQAPSTTIMVFDPSQIHILGSKKDLEQAKRFILNKTMLNTNSITNPTLNIPNFVDVRKKC